MRRTVRVALANLVWARHDVPELMDLNRPDWTYDLGYIVPGSQRGWRRASVRALERWSSAIVMVSWQQR